MGWKARRVLMLAMVPGRNGSATRMRRSRPLPKSEGPSSRSAMLQTSRTVVLMSLTPGMVRDLWIEEAKNFECISRLSSSATSLVCGSGFKLRDLVRN